MSVLDFGVFCFCHVRFPQPELWDTFQAAWSVHWSLLKLISTAISIVCYPLRKHWTSRFSALQCAWRQQFPSLSCKIMLDTLDSLDTFLSFFEISAQLEIRWPRHSHTRRVWGLKSVRQDAPMHHPSLCIICDVKWSGINNNMQPGKHMHIYVILFMIVSWYIHLLVIIDARHPPSNGIHPLIVLAVAQQQKQ